MLHGWKIRRHPRGSDRGPVKGIEAARCRKRHLARPTIRLNENVELRHAYRTEGAAKVAGLLRKVHVDALNLRSQHHVCGKAVFLACYRRELTRRILVQEHHELRGRPRSADGLPGCCFT